ncbi:hypothetical protein ACFWZ3_04820 [Frateuria sp. GZRR35]|uniref:hypothetical protein n=1 Tax=Frateuria sp. GZRR35 TaxID=3351536 RepID=UPI003EDB9CBE
MKLLSFVAAVAMASPICAAATVSMEAQQSVDSGDAIQAPPSDLKARRPLFIVKFVLRRAAADAPPIVIDDASPRLTPPGNDFPATRLGALERDPNTLVCYGWGCQRKP